MLESCDYFFFLSYSNLYPVLQFTATNTFLWLLSLDQKFYILYVYAPPKNNGSRTLPQFFLSNDIHNLQTTLISTKCNQKNKNNNMKLNSTSSEPYIRLQRAIRLQNKLNGKIRLSSFSLKYTSEYNPTR